MSADENGIPAQLTELVDEQAVELIEAGLSFKLQSAVAFMERDSETGQCRYITDLHGLPHRSEFCRYLRSFDQGEAACFNCDCDRYRHLEMVTDEDPEPYHFCHMGLADIGVPVLVGGKMLGALYSGQRRMPGTSKQITRNVNQIAKKIDDLDQARLSRLIKEIPEADEEELLRLRLSVVEAALHLQRFAETHYGLTKAIRDRERLVAETIHELRAALHATLIEAEFLEAYQTHIAGGSIPPEISDVLERIIHEILRMKDTTLTQLLMSRAQVAGGAIPQREYKLDTLSDLESLIDQCIHQYRWVANPRGINIEKTIRSKEPLRFGFDRESMRLVVGNLLDNAVKYSYDDTYIRVTAQREDRTIHVTVENMGTGIAEAELEKIFEPFYRAEHRDPRRLIWGSGLGLSVAREIVGAHGGRIWAESEAGGRSADETAQYVGFKNVFHFTLPFRGKGEHGE